jgi:uncharacterized protein YndB with AHSA1/START domain
VAFQEERGTVRWRMHFRSAPTAVYDALATDGGRARFWAESAVERGGVIGFRILGYPPFSARVLRREPPRLFALEYLGTVATFALESDGEGGTELRLLNEGVGEEERMEMTAGWVSVLMAMKAAVDFGVDLRNHHLARTWTGGYADN